MPKKITHITTSELILSAIFYLQQKNGVTAKEITKYVCEKRGCAQKYMKESVKKALERATMKGIFCQNKGLYRINDGFGVNKILTNKTQRRGKKKSKETKAKAASERKKDFEVHFEKAMASEQKMPLSEIVDERMNDVYDNRGFYIELPRSSDQDDDNDEDFEDTEDDDDETGFFSDDMDENEAKTEPKTLFFNKNVDGMNGSSDCNSFTDPLGMASKVENKLSEERKENGKEEKRDRERDIPGSEQIREDSKETLENLSRTVQWSVGNLSDDEDQDKEGNGDLHLEVNWDCQLNDCLLEGDDYPMDMAQGKHVGSAIAWENTKRMKIPKNTSRINLSIEDNLKDSFEANHMHSTR